MKEKNSGRMAEREMSGIVSVVGTPTRVPPLKQI